MIKQLNVPLMTAKYLGRNTANKWRYLTSSSLRPLEFLSSKPIVLLSALNLQSCKVKRKCLLSSALTRIITAVLIGMSATTAAQAQSTLPKFSCTSSFYETIDGQLSKLNIVTGQYDPIGPDQFAYNGTGYNENDDYVYGFGQEGTILNHLIRVGSDGNIESLGDIGLTSARGTFDDTNRLFYGGNSKRLNFIDVTTKTTGLLSFSLASGSAALQPTLDYAYTVSGGEEFIVGARDGDVLIYNLTTGVSRRVAVAGLPNGGFGAAWGASNGSVYFSANGDGTNYEILNIGTTPTIGATFSAAVSTVHDGMACASAPPPFVAGPGLTLTKLASRDTDVPIGDTVSYTYTVTNIGNVNIENVTVNDVHGGAGSLGTVALGSLTNNSGNSSDDGADNDLDVLAPSDVITFTADYLIVPGDAGNSVSNTATANGSATTGMLTPPTATETITVKAAATADLSITKTNTPGVNGEVDQTDDTVTTGDNTTYTLVVKNNGPDSVTGAVVKDTPTSGLTCTGTDTVTLSGDGIPTGTFTIADLTGAGITLDTLADGQSTTLTYSCEVN